MKIDIPDLDPGIKDMVQLLQEHKFETVDSGDGTKLNQEGVLPFPHVFSRVQAADMIDESHRLRELMDSHGFQNWSIEATYSPDDGLGILALFTVPI